MSANLPQAFEILIANAHDAYDAAARQLADAMVWRKDSLAKRDLLAHYRSDYLNRAHSGLGDAQSVPGLARVGAFLAKLDEAIGQQEADLAMREQTVARARALLAQADRKLKSLEIYVERKERSAAEAERRRDQKSTDEYAQRAAQRTAVAGGSA